jgi:hypothetical protein
MNPIKKIRVKDLERGDIFRYSNVEWCVVRREENKILYRRNIDRAGWSNDFGINSMMLVEYVGKRANYIEKKRKTKIQ